jgi:hypothetical protein
MPYFQPRGTHLVEAYRLPQEGQQASDGLGFFLSNAPMPIYDVSGDWIIRDGEEWRRMKHDDFIAAYKPWEG